MQKLLNAGNPSFAFDSPFQGKLVQKNSSLGTSLSIH